jgi:hypothetical protein
MKELFGFVQKRLAKRNLATLSIGAFLVQLCKNKSTAPDELTGYVKHHILYVRLPMSDDRMQWFVTREELKKELNQQLKDM